MNPRQPNESLLDYILRWLEWRECQKVVQTQLRKEFGQ